MSASYAELLLENARLRSKVAELQSVQQQHHQDGKEHRGGAPASPPRPPGAASSPSLLHSLDRRAILRYSRHLLCSEFGRRPVVSQSAVLRARVLVLGAGGLGCPVLLHLAAAGVGTLGIVDQDVIDLSNLPRQTLYDDRHIGRSKAEVAAQRARRINAHCTALPYALTFSPANAVQLVSGFDVVVDCSDNPSTRYLCNDACVLLGRPCVSGSALRMEGQLTVYGWRGGPCYRCLFPQPPPAHAVTNCNEGGVLNAVTGCIGALQALEVLKLIALSAEDEAKEERKQQPPQQQQLGKAADGGEAQSGELDVLSGRLLCFDATSTAFRVVRLRPRSPRCAVCGEQRTIDLSTLSGRSDGEMGRLCAADSAPSSALSSVPSPYSDDAPGSDPSAVDALSVTSIPPSAFASLYHSDPSSPAPPSPFVVVDVRPSLQFDICHLERSINLPLASLAERMDELEAAVEDAARCWERSSSVTATSGAATPTVFVVCRRGVDSTYAAAVIERQRERRRPVQCHAEAWEEKERRAARRWTVLNVEGGLMAWTQQVDPAFPLY